MVCYLSKCILEEKIPMSRLNKPGVPQQHTKTRYAQVFTAPIQASEFDIQPYHVSELISQDIKTVHAASDWLNCEFVCDS